MRLHRAITFASLILVVAFTVGAGCTIEEDGSSPGTRTPTPKAPARHQVVIYLLRGEQLGVARRTVTGSRVALGAMRALLAAPSPADRAVGLGTTIPAGTRVLGVSIRNGTATVNLTRRFESGGGSLSMIGRVTQVVWTLTQFPSVRRVAFQLNGRRARWIGGEGIIVWPPVDRADFDGMAPPILVERPAPYDLVRSPLVVAGSANVFEAVLFVELRDGGRVVTRRRVMATAGTGTRGSFSTRLRFSGVLASPVLVAYDLSPRDGSRQDVVRIPLRSNAR